MIEEPRRRTRRLLAVLSLYLVCVIVQSLYVHGAPVMWVFYDEYAYDGMARDIAAGAPPKLNESAPCRYPPLYALVLALPARLAGDQRFLLARLLNVVLYSLAVCAVYAIARRFVEPAPALIAAAGSVLGPALVIPRLFLSENLYIPLFAFYVLGVIRTFERPTYGRIALAGVLAAACCWTKLNALFPIAAAGLFLLFQLPVHGSGRVLRVALHAVVFLALLLPGIDTFRALLHYQVLEPQSVPRAAAADYIWGILRHFLAPLLSIGPLLCAGALAFGANGPRRPTSFQRGLGRLFLVLVAATILGGALWIVTARPGMIRVEERYQFAVYPLIIVLAVAAIEAVPRAWFVLFAAAAAALLLCPIDQLDPGHDLHWSHLNPSPVPLRLAGDILGPTAARVAFLVGWSILALLVWPLRNSPWRRVAWAGVLAPGLCFLWLHLGPIQRDVVRENRRVTEELETIQDLRQRYLGRGDRIVFAGGMPPRVPYAAASFWAMPFWHQWNLDSPNWFPGRFERDTGRIAWMLAPAAPVWLLASDGISCGGEYVDRRGEWRLYRLAADAPRLHSLLVANPVAPSEVNPEQFDIYLWPLEAGRRRWLQIEPDRSGGIEAKFLMLAPFLETRWRSVAEATEIEIPALPERGLSWIQLEVRGGRAAVTMRDDASPRPR
ncbi:MAG: glycosyltransferase family 39 protein [Planctomycetes bacterium]|nr:glycosyltransferase family 39 protein [Planctomycetota bacterium]